MTLLIHSLSLSLHSLSLCSLSCALLSSLHKNSNRSTMTAAHIYGHATAKTCVANHPPPLTYPEHIDRRYAEVWRWDFIIYYMICNTNTLTDGSPSRIVSTATQWWVPGLPQPGTTKTNAPNPLDASSARRERSFMVIRALHRLVLADVLFSPPKFRFFTQPHNNNYDGSRTHHRPELTPRCSSRSNRQAGDNVWR